MLLLPLLPNPQPPVFFSLPSSLFLCLFILPFLLPRHLIVIHRFLMGIKFVHTGCNSVLFSYFHLIKTSHIPKIILDLVVGLKPKVVNRVLIKQVWPYGRRHSSLSLPPFEIKCLPAGRKGQGWHVQECNTSAWDRSSEGDVLRSSQDVRLGRGPGGSPELTALTWTSPGKPATH